MLSCNLAVLLIVLRRDRNVVANATKSRLCGSAAFDVYFALGNGAKAGIAGGLSQLKRRGRSGHLKGISSRIKGVIRRGGPFRGRLKSHDDFACPRSVVSDGIERSSDFF
jgi:hypothetical protein